MKPNVVQPALDLGALDANTGRADRQTHQRALQRSNRSLRLGLVGALLILLMLVTLPPATTAWTTSLREQRSGRIQEFEETRSRTESAVQRMQAAMRGYLITQQRSFLETYQSAGTQLQSDLEQLRRLAPEVTPELERPVGDLQERIERWLADGPEKQLELMRANNLAAAVAEVSTGQSQKRFDTVIEQLMLLRSEIARLDAALSTRVSMIYQLETAGAVGLGALGVALGIYLVRVFGDMSRLATAIERERQRAEGAVVAAEEAQRELAREQQRLQVIFEQSPEGIIFVEATSAALVLANPAARELLGTPLTPGEPMPRELLQRLYRSNGERFPPEDLPFVRALRGESRIGVELVIEHPDGQRTPVLFNSVPLHDPSGNVGGAVGIFQDLSHFREVERLKSDFVAMVSHELRTPLTAIQGCTQALLRGPNGADAQRQREFLEIIDQQSGRLHELIDNLLNLSQVEAGAMRLRLGPLQPARLVRTIARQAGERLQNVTVQADVPLGLPTISADQYRVEQVLLNLLDNAGKYSPPGGIITVRVEPRGAEILFSVTDQGPGIREADRERIFDRFYQGTQAPATTLRGTGLGLAICKALVEAHGGRIWADGASDQGTRMCFTLPARLVDEPRETAMPSTVQRTREGPHVLIVDDEPTLRQMLDGTLRNAGYIVGTVPEGQAALEYLATQQPDMVVLDLMLPGQDGFRVLQQIRDWSNVLVMILTASIEPDKVVRGLQLGADDYLTKPFNMNEFLARVDALLRRRSNGTESQQPAILQRGPLLIDWSRRSVERHRKPVELTPIEFRLLAYLAQHAGQVLTHEQILRQVWGPEYGGESQYLWVHIGRLRQKIEANPKAPELIVTERGVGYRFAAE